MSIEQLERQVAAERSNWTAEMRQRAKAEADVGVKRDQQRQAEAEAAYIALDECGKRLQALNAVSDRSIKDRLCTPILQIENSKEELRQVFRTIKG